MSRRLLELLRGLALVVGEADYARYCRHLRERHPGRPLPSPREFYLARLEERYTRPARCS